MSTSSQQRDLRINLSANAAGMERGLARADKAMERHQRKVEDTANAIARLEMELQADIDRTLAEVEAASAARAESYAAAGQGMLVAGAAITAGLGMAARAAIQWESDWAGVTKVLDATPDQVEALESGLRGLALQIPATQSELAGIAGAAAQLGIESQNILTFTSTVAAMGVATDMVAEEAAMQMARFSAIMGTPQESVDQLGSAIVELGNNSAATESEIMTMAMRIAGAGSTVGITEGEVLGFAAALTSVGMEAEAGGSAVSRVLLSINDAVSSGGANLTEFAKVAGVSASSYTDAWRDDPAQATHEFVAGLARMQSEGENVNLTLGKLGLGEIVVRDALLRMAGASDLVAESLELGNRGWAENSALVEEAAARYATTESQIQIARNAINETGIAIGEGLLPILGEAASRITDYGAAFSSLDEGQQQWVAGISGSAGALALLTGALITIGPRVIEFRTQMQDLHTGGATRLQRGIGGLAAFMTGPYGAAIAGVLALGGIWLDQKAQQIAREQEWARVLTETNGAVTGATAAHAAQRLQDEGLLEISRELGVEQGRLTDALLTNGEARQALATLSELAATSQQGLVSGNSSEAASLAELNAAVETLFGSGTKLSDLNQTQLEELSGLQYSVAGLTEEMVAGQEEMAASTAETQAQAATYLTAAEAADAFAESISRVNGMIAESISAELDYNATMLRVTETVTANAGATDRHTEAGIANHRSLLDLITAGETETRTMIANEDSTEALEAQKVKLREDLELLRNTVGLTDEQFAEYDEMLRNVESEIDTAIQVRANGTWSTSPTQNSSHTSPRGGAPAFYASGGAVSGPGTGTSDSIDARLSTGEHVFTAEEVEALGGQERVYALRSLIRSGVFQYPDQPQRFARGGAALPRPARIVDDHDEDTRIKIQQLFADTTAGAADEMAQAWKRLMESGGSVVSAWRSQLGVPYSWGGGGPGGPGYGIGRGSRTRGFDCSSLMQFGWAKAGVSLPRVTYAQINYGRAVQRGQERPGDLVFPHRGHVAGVVAPGRLIHAPYTGATVSYRNMYPHPIAIRRPGRYDDGGRLEHGQSGVNLSRRPERVLSPRQTDAFERLVEGLLSGATIPAGQPIGGHGPGEVHYHVHHVPGLTTVQDLARAEDQRQTRVRAGRRG